MKTILLLLLAVWLCGPVSAEGIRRITFDPRYEVAGEKLALKEINPSLPRDWSRFRYVVLEYRITTSQRFHVGLTTRGGYNELRVMCYVPNAWNRLVIPLRFFTDQPGSAIDLAATYNQPRFTGWINLGGHRCPLVDVDSIGFRMQCPIGQPSLELRNVYLTREDPGDLYMETRPAVDEFGQNNLIDYAGKVKSLSELQQQWRAEEAEEVSTAPFNYSRYGGYLQKKLKATGFFRVQKLKDRWWLVDPDGYLFLSVGVDCVHLSNGGSVRGVNRRGGMFKELPPADVLRLMGQVNAETGEPVPSFGWWNLYRRYGSQFEAKATDMIFKRMDKWGINTIANWSDGRIAQAGRKAFLHQLYDLGLSGSLMGLADVYDPDFVSHLDRSLARQVASLKDHPWLIGYFLGNEPAWLGRERALCQMILDGGDRPIKQALRSYLSQHGDSDASRSDFVYETFATFLGQTDTLLKKHDPHHLNLGMRFGDPYGLSERLLRLCGRHFDVYSFNCYDKAPRKDGLDRIRDLTDLPIMIGEFHFGSVDRGYGQSLWQTDNQTARAQAYRYYVEQAYAHPSLVGTAYFQWADQDMLGRFDGENYNCGLVDVTDRPYAEQVAAMTLTATRLYDIHSGRTAPFSQAVKRMRGHGGLPNLWNK